MCCALSACVALTNLFLSGVRLPGETATRRIPSSLGLGGNSFPPRVLRECCTQSSLCEFSKLPFAALPAGWPIRWWPEDAFAFSSACRRAVRPLRAHSRCDVVLLCRSLLRGQRMGILRALPLVPTSPFSCPSSLPLLLRTGRGQEQRRVPADWTQKGRGAKQPCAASLPWPPACAYTHSWVPAWPPPHPFSRGVWGGGVLRRLPCSSGSKRTRPASLRCPYVSPTWPLCWCLLRSSLHKEAFPHEKTASPPCQKKFSALCRLATGVLQSNTLSHCNDLSSCALGDRLLRYPWKP